jgi:hypothetical protein
MEFSLSQISMLGLGGAALIGGGLMAIRRLRMLRYRKAAAGIVVSTPMMGATLAPSSVMNPIVEFTTDTGELRRIEIWAAWSAHRLKIGQQVKIIYDPTEAGEAYLQTLMNVWYAPIFAIALALAVFVLVLTGAIS